MKLQHVDFLQHVKNGGTLIDHITLTEWDGRLQKEVPAKGMGEVDLEADMTRRLVSVRNWPRGMGRYRDFDVPFERVKLMVRSESSMKIEKARKVKESK